LSSIEAEIDLQMSNMRKGGMDMNMSKKNKKKKADEIIPKKKKKRAEMDLETSSSSEKPKRRPTKKAVLVGLKPPEMVKMNSVDVKAQILRMKKHLMEQRGFPE
ncbi:hypothetical protein A2U01_0069567, partial [Trifolium medium]|nr:hypothetical protein [Trifolium medium]